MDHTLSRLLTVAALGVLSSVLALTACTHTSERVVEPVGGGDASSPSPEVADADVSPIGPIAQPVELEPKEDFRLVRAPEFQVARDVNSMRLSAERQGGLGGSDGVGGAGFGGSDLRPVHVGPVARGSGHYY